MKREKYMDIAITVMFIAIYFSLVIATSFLKVFSGCFEHLYYSALECYVFVKISYKLLWWICGKIDKLERKKR